MRQQGVDFDAGNVFLGGGSLLHDSDAVDDDFGLLARQKSLDGKKIGNIKVIEDGARLKQIHMLEVRVADRTANRAIRFWIRFSQALEELVPQHSRAAQN
jgi:hypothetical protein